MIKKKKDVNGNDFMFQADKLTLQILKKVKEMEEEEEEGEAKEEEKMKDKLEILLRYAWRYYFLSLFFFIVSFPVHSLLVLTFLRLLCYS